MLAHPMPHVYALKSVKGQLENLRVCELAARLVETALYHRRWTINTRLKAMWAMNDDGEALCEAPRSLL